MPQTFAPPLINHQISMKLWTISALWKMEINRITAGSVKHNNSFVQVGSTTCPTLIVHHPVGKNERLNMQFRIQIEVSISQQ